MSVCPSLLDIDDHIICDLCQHMQTLGYITIDIWYIKVYLEFRHKRLQNIKRKNTTESLHINFNKLVIRKLKHQGNDQMCFMIRDAPPPPHTHSKEMSSLFLINGIEIWGYSTDSHQKIKH